MSAGIVSYGAYIPIYRLSLSTLAQVWGGPGLIFEAEDAIRGKSKQIAYPTKFSEMQLKIRRSLPMLEEHTMEVLTSLGYTTEEVEELQKGG